MGDVTDATLPKEAPRNLDGSPREDGEISVDQAQILGAIDTESMAKNKHTANVLRKRATGEGDRNVTLNAENITELFGSARTAYMKEWGLLSVTVTRLEPEPRVAFPPISATSLKDDRALYAYVEQCHERAGVLGREATYQVAFHAGAMRRAKCSVVMPAVMQPTPQQPQQQQPMQPQSYGYERQPMVVQMPPQPVPMMHEPSSDMTRVFEMMLQQSQSQTTAMLGAVKELAEAMKRPQMPPGFIPLPEGWPTIPEGYVAVPGGCIPRPQPTHAPAPPQVVVQAPAPQVAAPHSPPQSMAMVATSPAAQVREAVQMVSGLVKSVDDMRGIFGGGTPSVAGAVGAAEDMMEEVVDTGVVTHPIGEGLSMVINKKDGTTNWPATLIGALPKFVEIGKGAVQEYSKVVDRQAALAKQTLDGRIRLAQEVQRAGIPVTQSLPSPAPSPQVQVRPVQPVPPPRPKVGIPSKIDLGW